MLRDKVAPVSPRDSAPNHFGLWKFHARLQTSGILYLLRPFPNHATMAKLALVTKLHCGPLSNNLNLLLFSSSQPFVALSGVEKRLHAWYLADVPTPSLLTAWARWSLIKQLLTLSCSNGSLLHTVKPAPFHDFLKAKVVPLFITPCFSIKTFQKDSSTRHAWNSFLSNNHLRLSLLVECVNNK